MSVPRKKTRQTADCLTRVVVYTPPPADAGGVKVCWTVSRRRATRLINI
ncbi:hypothetical protein BURMUCF2_1444 [Burkholderia multivorans CF2]|nr:hypothetical protein BURMUCF2_1444 [Burkholderia multivorans CF2]